MNDEDAEPERILIEPRDNIECDLLELAERISTIAFRCCEEALCGNDEYLGKGAFRGREQYLNFAVKFSRTYTELIKAFDYHRGKGKIEQKIIVQHQYVNIADGAQAVINPRHGEGGGRKNGKQSLTKQIEHAPQPAMPSAHTEGQPMPIPCHA